MAMKITKDSHLDHGVTTAQLAWLLEQFGDRDGFFIETVDLPTRLGTVPCGLYGPLMGDDPVGRVAARAPRAPREWPSRLVHRPLRQVSQVSVIAGPHEGDACVLYTVFGGPVAPQEPGDPKCNDKEASESFWAEHALSMVGVGMVRASQDVDDIEIDLDPGLLVSVDGVLEQVEVWNGPNPKATGPEDECSYSDRARITRVWDVLNDRELPEAEWPGGLADEWRERVIDSMLPEDA